jgi:hypothetical protein
VLEPSIAIEPLKPLSSSAFAGGINSTLPEPAVGVLSAIAGAVAVASEVVPLAVVAVAPGVGVGSLPHAERSIVANTPTVSSIFLFFLLTIIISYFPPVIILRRVQTYIWSVPESMRWCSDKTLESGLNRFT